MKYTPIQPSGFEREAHVNRLIFPVLTGMLNSKCGQMNGGHQGFSSQTPAEAP